MKSFLLILVICGILCEVHAINETIKELLSPKLVSTEEISDKHDEVVKVKLAREILTEIHDLAKNISHSKGIIREVDGQKEVRRSVLKKASVAAESALAKVILSVSESDDIAMSFFNELENVFHDYDIAVNLAKGGAMKFLPQLLFYGDPKIVSAVVSILASAMQNNPIVQKLAIEHDVGKILVFLLCYGPPNIASRIVFGLSCFLRNSPEAQVHFLFISGVYNLAKMLNNSYITTDVKLKIITLIEDLVIEQETEEFHQYSRVTAALRRSFAHEIKKVGICKYIAEFLTIEDYKVHAKVVSAMLSLHDICRNEFKEVTNNLRLETLLKIYDLELSNKSFVNINIDLDLKEALVHKLILQHFGVANSTKYPVTDEL